MAGEKGQMTLGPDTPPTGEEVQQRGAEGVNLAKRWLESTCRAEVKWNNPTKETSKLQFVKASAPNPPTLMEHCFSFDLGGLLIGGDTDGKVFLAEVKSGETNANHGTEYRAFLAKSYRAKQIAPAFYDYFLWITWVPFLSSKWPELLTGEYVKESVESNESTRGIALGAEPTADGELCTWVAACTMIVVLSDRQIEVLSLQRDEASHVRESLLKL